MGFISKSLARLGEQEDLAFVSNDHAGLTTEYFDNKVYMPFRPVSAGLILTNATYTLTDFSITTGKDPEQRIAVGQQRSYVGTKGSMTFSVGRQGSVDVATWWKNHIPQNANSFNQNPDQLNFAFIGTLTLYVFEGAVGLDGDTFTLRDFALAQGQSGESEIWWCGSKTGKNLPSWRVDCTGYSSSDYPWHFQFRCGGPGTPVDTIELVDMFPEPWTTFSLLPRERGENEANVVNWKTFPPYVIYLTPALAANLRVGVAPESGGLQYNQLSWWPEGRRDAGMKTGPYPVMTEVHADELEHSDGKPLGRTALWVLSTAGELFISMQHKPGMFHHSSIVAGADIAGAGEIKTDLRRGQRGQMGAFIKSVNNWSGHYRPDPRTTKMQLQEALHRMGYTDPFPFQTASVAAMMQGPPTRSSIPRTVTPTASDVLFERCKKLSVSWLSRFSCFKQDIREDLPDDATLDGSSTSWGSESKSIKRGEGYCNSV